MISIRKLGHDDVDEFIRLRLEGLRMDPTSFGSNYEKEFARPECYFVDFLAASRRRIVWGAFRDGKMVGLVRLDHEGRGCQRFIYSMYVTAAERGRGLGRRLLKTAITRAKRAPQVRQICLTVETTNKTALDLYRSEGFAEYGIDKDTYCVDGKIYYEYLMRKFVRSRGTARRGKG